MVHPCHLAKSFVAAAVLMALGAPALAGGDAQKLEYVLSGPAIGGVTPSGKAVIDQPSLPGTLTCEVQNVNLPDGTVLDIVIVDGYRAGTLTLSGGRGKMQASIPFQVRTGPFEVKLGTNTVMTGRFKN